MSLSALRAPTCRSLAERSCAGGGRSGGSWWRVARALAALVLAWLALAALSLPALAQGGAIPEVFGVRFGVNQSTTRVVLDIDRPSRFAARVLAMPPRLVVDLDEVRWRVREHPQGRPRGLARGVSYGRLDAGRARLVVEVERPFRILRQEHLPPSGEIRHHRIIVDLAPLAAPSRPAVSAARAPEVGPPRPRPESVAGTAETVVAVTAAEPPAPTVLPLPGGAPLPLPAATVEGPADGDAVQPGAGPANSSLTNERADDAPAGDGAGEAVAVSLLATPVARPPALPARRRVIALDAGHGGADPGTIGINGVYEKVITLEMARQLRDLLEATGRYEVVMTRDSDVYVSLRERMETARRAQAALFISIHADSIGNASFGGASVYTLSDQASDAEAARLAAKENRADIIAGTDLSAHDEIVAGILIDLAQRVTNNSSIEFADVLTSELAESTRLVRNTRRFAGFVVLKSPDVPSVLLELGYLSNPTDAANLARPEYRERLARATLRAIDRHFANVNAAL